MTITIEARHLVRLLNDLLDTEAGTGIHLATHRAAIGDEPGLGDVLAGMSGSGFVLGHTWAACIGQGTAAVWPADSASIVVAMCKTLHSKDDQATVDILAETAPSPETPVEGQHPGWTITVRETPALFDSDTHFEFHAKHASEFPTDGFQRILTRDDSADPRHVETLLTAWSPNVLTPLLKIAKRRCTSKHVERLKLYRARDRDVHLVQIGDDWMGAAMPMVTVPPELSGMPSIEPLFTNDLDAES